MGKQYELVSNSRRLQLIQLIHLQGMSISQAAKITKIYYPTAKAINKVYRLENRVFKNDDRPTTLKKDSRFKV
jgi:transposase